MKAILDILRPPVDFGRWSVLLIGAAFGALGCTFSLAGRWGVGLMFLLWGLVLVAIAEVERA